LLVGVLGRFCGVLGGIQLGDALHELGQQGICPAAGLSFFIDLALEVANALLHLPIKTLGVRSVGRVRLGGWSVGSVHDDEHATTFMHSR